MSPRWVFGASIPASDPTRPVPFRCSRGVPPAASAVAGVQVPRTKHRHPSHTPDGDGTGPAGQVWGPHSCSVGSSGGSRPGGGRGPERRVEVGACWRVLRALTLRKLPAALRSARWLKMNEFLVTGSFRKRSPSAVTALGKQPRGGGDFVVFWFFFFFRDFRGCKSLEGRARPCRV